MAMGRASYRANKLSMFLYVSDEVAEITRVFFHVFGEVAQIARFFCIFLARWPDYSSTLNGHKGGDLF